MGDDNRRQPTTLRGSDDTGEFVKVEHDSEGDTEPAKPNVLSKAFDLLKNNIGKSGEIGSTNTLDYDNKEHVEQLRKMERGRKPTAPLARITSMAVSFSAKQAKEQDKQKANFRYVLMQQELASVTYIKLCCTFRMYNELQASLAQYNSKYPDCQVDLWVHNEGIDDKTRMTVIGDIRIRMLKARVSELEQLPHQEPALQLVEELYLQLDQRATAHVGEYTTMYMFLWLFQQPLYSLRELTLRNFGEVSLMPRHIFTIEDALQITRLHLIDTGFLLTKWQRRFLDEFLDRGLMEVTEEFKEAAIIAGVDPEDFVHEDMSISEGIRLFKQRLYPFPCLEDLELTGDSARGLDITADHLQVLRVSCKKVVDGDGNVTQVHVPRAPHMPRLELDSLVISGFDLDILSEFFHDLNLQDKQFSRLDIEDILPETAARSRDKGAEWRDVVRDVLKGSGVEQIELRATESEGATGAGMTLAGVFIAAIHDSVPSVQHLSLQLRWPPEPQRSIDLVRFVDFWRPDGLNLHCEPEPDTSRFGRFGVSRTQLNYWQKDVDADGTTIEVANLVLYYY